MLSSNLYGNPKEKEKAGKVEVICNALRAHLEQINENNNYLLPVLTTYVKKQPQELKEVLNLIKDMRKEEQENESHSDPVPPHLNPQTMKKDKKKTAQSSEDALKYVSWLVNANKLYDVALTTYDFDLVILVAT